MKKQEVKEFIKTHRKEIITIVLGSGLAIFCGVKFHSRIKPIVSSVAEPDNTVMVFKGCDGKNRTKGLNVLIAISLINKNVISFSKHNISPFVIVLLPHKRLCIFSEKKKEEPL